MRHRAAAARAAGEPAPPRRPREDAGAPPRATPRRRAALLGAAEELARACGKTLLVLDTASADAERLYARAGWQRVGTVPGYALLPDGAPCDTTFFYRDLAR